MDINKLKSSGNFRFRNFQTKFKQAVKSGGFSHLEDNEAGVLEVIKKKKDRIMFGKFGSPQQNEAWRQLKKLEEKTGVEITGPDKRDIKKIFKVLGSKKINIQKADSETIIPKSGASHLNRDNIVSTGRLKRQDITNRAKREGGEEMNKNYGFAGSNKLIHPGEASGVHLYSPGQAASKNVEKSRPGWISNTPDREDQNPVSHNQVDQIANHSPSFGNKPHQESHRPLPNTFFNK